MLTGNKTLKNHSDSVELKKFTTGVKRVRRNSSKSTTKICGFRSGQQETVLLDKMRKFDTIAEVNRYVVLMVTIHIIFMHYLIVLPLLLLNTNKVRYAL